jgi:sulfate adenylyltransferase subunit 1
LLNIPHVVVAINKMDLVDYSQDVYNNIVIEYAEMATSLGLKDVHYLPISALTGDNIVDKTEKLSWFTGEPLLSLLETVPVAKDINLTDARLPVQFVIRPQTEALHDYRGYAGKIISGIYRKGDAVTVLPSGLSSTIKAVELGGVEVEAAMAPQSIVLQLEHDIDISRGDLIVKTGQQPTVENELTALLCWMDSKPLLAGNKYSLQLNSTVVRAIVKEIEYKLDVNTLAKEYNPAHVGLNDIVKVKIKTASPLPYDPYNQLQANGGAILIDETSHVTVGACMLQ